MLGLTICIFDRNVIADRNLVLVTATGQCLETKHWAIRPSVSDFIFDKDAYCNIHMIFTMAAFRLNTRPRDATPWLTGILVCSKSQNLISVQTTMYRSRENTEDAPHGLKFVPTASRRFDTQMGIINRDDRTIRS